MPHSLRSPAPVSYTHLDVYKRQLYRGAYGCEGTVVDDATGQPLPGMTVELVTNSGTVGGTTTTDQNGQFEVMGSAGLAKYSLRVSGSGYETYLNGDFLFALNEPSNVGTIRMKALNLSLIHIYRTYP